MTRFYQAKGFAGLIYIGGNSLSRSRETLKIQTHMYSTLASDKPNVLLGSIHNYIVLSRSGN